MAITTPLFTLHIACSSPLAEGLTRALLCRAIEEASSSVETPLLPDSPGNRPDDAESRKFRRVSSSIVIDFNGTVRSLCKAVVSGHWKYGQYI